MANKFQSVDFKSVEEFLDYLPEEEYVVVQYLRELIFSCVPRIKEKLSYNVPFYSLNKRLFYIWPSAVQWGNVKRSGVGFGFCTGHLLHDELNYLDKGTRKQVYTKTFHNISEIDSDLMKMFIFEAVEIDQSR